MPSFSIDNAQWRDQLAAHLPAQLRSLLRGASGRDLLRKVDTTFLLLDDELVHLESRKAARITGPGAQPIAAACAELLSSQSAEQRKECVALLLLPAKYFVATKTTLPGVTQESLMAALKIQAESILPSLEEPVSLAVNPQSANAGSEHLALWMTEATLNELFQAFEEHDVFLAAIKPRFLIDIADAAEDRRTKILDSDAETETCVLIENNIIKSLQPIPKQDLQQDVFQQQWQEQVSNTVAENVVELNEAADYASHNSSQGAEANQDYCFFPHGALNASRQTAKGKQTLAAAAAVAVLIFLAAIPFIAQSIEFRSLAATLQTQRDMASDARQDQAAVVSFENEWGLISDFPEQRIADAMFTLQNILRPDTLTSMEVADGLIKIQGSSSEPQAILQRLEQDPMFTEVVFSRATNNSRYYIDLRLSTVNFEGYMIRYFPDE